MRPEATTPQPEPLRSSRRLAAVPPVAGEIGGRSDLPRPLTSLVGRDADVADARMRLMDGGPRLLTLIGPGGVGKTRLAIRLGEVAAAAFADGVVFVPLAAIADAALVVPAIAQALGLQLAGGRSPIDTVIGYLHPRELLLVLDNCEQVQPAATDVAAILSACPAVSVLATSRVPLRIAGEQRFPVAPLALPPAARGSDSGGDVALGAVAASPAVQLFVARAGAIDPGFVLDQTNAADVAAICRRLDGLPLAIELAAARTHLLEPAELHARLSPVLPLLSKGPDDAPGRLRTMRDAIVWSYDLLSADERALFRALAVFVGGFMLDAAEAVGGCFAGAPPFPPLPPSVLDLVASLVDKSLLQRMPGEGERRFGMLETIREFALDQLQASGEAEEIAGRHAAWCVDLAEAAANAAGRAGSGDWMRRLAAERSNLRAALDWCEQTGQTDAALRMTGALWHYWYPLGDVAEGRTRLERALRAAPDGNPVLRAQALRGAGVLARQSADYAVSRDRLEAALAVYRARADRTGIAWSLNELGCLAATQAEQERAEAYFGEALALFREGDDAVGIAQLATNFGELAAVEGRHALAIELLEEALALWRGLANRVGVVRTQVALGEALLAQGDLERTDAALREVLIAIRDIDYEQILPAVLRIAAESAARRGHGVTAARRYGAADRIRERLGMEVSTTRRAAYERAVAAVRDTLGEAEFAVAWDAGRALALDDAIAEATSLAGGETPPGSAHPAAGHLTLREREVLRLVARGCSDKEIAAELGIGRRTVSTHVSTLRAKLGASSRSAAAAIAARDQLI